MNEWNTCPNGHGDWFAACGIATCRVCSAQWKIGLLFAFLSLATGGGQ